MALVLGSAVQLCLALALSAASVLAVGSAIELDRIYSSPSAS